MMFVGQIMQQWNGECSRLIESPVWMKARQKGMDWQEAIGSPEALKEAVGLLTPYGLIMLKLLLKHGGLSAMEEEKLIKAGIAEGMLAGLEAKAGVRELQTSGLLIAVAKLWGERLLFVPKDTYPLLVALFLPANARPASTGEIDESFQLCGAACRPLGRQLLSALAELARGGTALTGKGSLPKKQSAKLQSVMELTGDALQPFAKPADGAQDYPLPVALLLHTAFSYGLLQRKERVLNWNTEDLQNWLWLDEEERELQLYRWLSAELLADKPAVALAATAAAEVEPGVWYMVKDAARWAETIYREMEEDFGSGAQGQNHLAGQADKPDLTPDLERWLNLLQQCGWLERGETGGESLFRFIRNFGISATKRNVEREAAEVPDYGIVQTNGELIVFPDCPFTLRWELESAAELVSDDQVAVYRMTEDSIRRAVSSGRTNESLQKLLQRLGGRAGVPQELLQWVYETVRQISRISVQEALLLQCNDVQMADELETAQPLKPFLGERIGPRHFIAAGRDAGPLRTALAAAGFPPLAGTGQGEKQGMVYPELSALAERDSAKDGLVAMPLQDTGLAFLLSPIRLSGYRLVRVQRDDPSAILPEASDVPAMWLNQMRAYHHSTRREMMEKALAWQTSVQLRMRDSLLAFVPEKLETAAEGWAVHGRLREDGKSRSIRLTPDMWQEMKLLVPI